MALPMLATVQATELPEATAVAADITSIRCTWAPTVATSSHQVPRPSTIFGSMAT